GRVLRRPRVLLLDEATTAFDEELQEEVLGRLKTLGITCICVTHRASTVAHADRVYVMEEGRVVQSGRPAELFAQDGPLARLHADQGAEQFRWTDNAPPPAPPPVPDHLYRRAAL